MTAEQIVVAIISGALFKALREELRFLEFLDRLEEMKDVKGD